MPAPDQNKLDYESTHWRQRRKRKQTRRVLIGFAVIIFTGPFLVRFARTEWTAWRDYCFERDIEQNVRNYHPPPTQIVVDDDPADFGKLLASDSHYVSGWTRGQVIFSPPSSLFSFASLTVFQPNSAMLYIGFRQTRAGTPDQVVCFALGTDFYAATISPTRFGHPPVWHHETHSDFVILRTAQQHLKIYAGQSDPADSSHFTIAYALGDYTGIIDGWLQDDETVKLQMRPGAVMWPSY